MEGGGGEGIEQLSNLRDNNSAPSYPLQKMYTLTPFKPKQGFKYRIMQEKFILSQIFQNIGRKKGM